MRKCPLLTDTVEKVVSDPPKRNNRTRTARYLNRNCVRGRDFESSVAHSGPQNRFSTVSTQSGHVAGFGHSSLWFNAVKGGRSMSLAQGLGLSDVVLPRALRSIGAACACDGLKPSDAPLPYPLTLIACACERFAGTRKGVSMAFSCRFDIPSNCAFSSIARDR